MKVFGGKIAGRVTVALCAGVLTFGALAGCAGGNAVGETEPSTSMLETAEARTAVIVQMRTERGLAAGVSVVRDNATISGYEGMRLAVGDVLSTDANTVVYLRIDADKNLRLSGNSRITVTEAGSDRIRIQVENGELFVNVENKLADHESMEFSAGSTTMSIRGTSLDIGYTEEDGLVLFVTDGHVAVSEDGAAGETMVNGGQMTEVEPGDTAEAIAVWNYSIEDLPDNVLFEMKENLALQERITDSFAETHGKAVEEVSEKLNRKLALVNGFDFGMNFLSYAENVMEKAEKEAGKAADTPDHSSVRANGKAADASGEEKNAVMRSSGEPGAAKESRDRGETGAEPVGVIRDTENPGEHPASGNAAAVATPNPMAGKRADSDHSSSDSGAHDGGSGKNGGSGSNNGNGNSNNAGEPNNANHGGNNNNGSNANNGAGIGGSAGEANTGNGSNAGNENNGTGENDADTGNENNGGHAGKSGNGGNNSNGNSNNAGDPGNSNNGGSTGNGNSNSSGDPDHSNHGANNSNGNANNGAGEGNSGNGSNSGNGCSNNAGNGSNGSSGNTNGNGGNSNTIPTDPGYSLDEYGNVTVKRDDIDVQALIEFMRENQATSITCPSGEMSGWPEDSEFSRLINDGNHFNHIVSMNDLPYTIEYAEEGLVIWLPDNDRVYDDISEASGSASGGTDPSTSHMMTSASGNAAATNALNRLMAGLGGDTNPAAGSTGADGADGTNSASGANGSNPTNGTAGMNSSTGTDGTNPTNGANGPDDTNSTTGTDGADGTNSTTGTNGSGDSNSTNGMNGTDGSNPATGTNRTDGTNSATGAIGSDAANSSTGTNDTNGSDPANGENSTGSTATGTASTSGNTGDTGAGDSSSNGNTSNGDATGAGNGSSDANTSNAD